MMTLRRWRVFATWILLLPGLTAPIRAGDEPATKPLEAVVTYEQFGAVGDGLTDDLPAICAAHAHANEHDLPVRSKPDATYHLGRRALTAIIQTDTDWSMSRFIIDDSQGVENHRLPLFEVRSRFAPVPLHLERLAAGQPRLEARPETDLLVLVENAHRRMFIRRGLNQNRGKEQSEVFILRRDGTVEGDIEWDYDAVTRVEARPIDARPLFVRGGLFVNLANRMRQPVGYNYWSRNILITRSNTTIDGLTHQVGGETDVGHPYIGFLLAQRAANITYRRCRVDGRKVYTTLGSANLPVPMGTYGYRADLVVNFRMEHCRTGDIHDASRWGVVATNFMKNVVLEDCMLSRMDVHEGVSGGYVIRRTTLGHAGLNAIGRGTLLVEDSTIRSGRFITFRDDYGSTWDGDVVIRNSRWELPPARGRYQAMFHVTNDGRHDFGYPCSMPRTIRIEGLYVDDSQLSPDHEGIVFFNDPLGESRGDRPHPYRLTEQVLVSDLKLASGRTPRVSPNPALVDAIQVTVSPPVGATRAQH